jgi:septum formation protein
MERIVLASISPRRRELLRDLGIDFTAIDPVTDETIRDYLPLRERVVALAVDKARAVADRLRAEGRILGDSRLVLGADTLVCIDSEARILGKPRDRDEARLMIRSLAGKEHNVHTGIALIDVDTDRCLSARSDSTVRFAPMVESEIEAYVDSGEWQGAAGGYRIQGRAAYHIDTIEGSWSGIVGLPIRELYGILRAAGCTPYGRGIPLSRQTP